MGISVSTLDPRLTDKVHRRAPTGKVPVACQVRSADSDHGAGLAGAAPLIWRAARTSSAYAVMASNVILATLA
jgi:hypothetical protein